MAKNLQKPFKKNHSKKSIAEWLLLGCMAVLLTFGIYITQETWKNKVDSKNKHVTSLAMSVEEALNGSDVKQLTGTATDINTAQYHSLKNRLMIIRRELNEPSFIYIYKEHAGKLYFMVDSEPEDSENCSPAGQVYYEANDECFIPIREGRIIITEPADDRWGRWISVLVPMRDAITGEVYAVMGMDYPSEGWYAEARLRTFQSAGIVMAMMLLLIALMVILKKNRALRHKRELQRIAEDNLREREVNFRTFIESMHDMIYICDLQGYILYMNPEIPRKLQYAYEELEGTRMTSFFSPDLSDEVYVTFLSILAGKNDHIPFPMMKKDGTTIFVENKVWFGKWNSRDCLFGISKDLSKEREALMKFNRFFQSNPALMAVSRISDGILTEVNSSFLEVLGYESAEVIGKPVKDIQLFSHTEKASALMQQLAKTQSIRNIETAIRTKNGNELMGLLSVEIIEIEGEQHMLAVMVDITHQKEVEEKALAASRAKSEFLANMSHEIRTPLNAVIGFAELLHVTPLDETQRQYVNHINVSGKTLLGIINDILDFSKIEAGRLELELIETDMIELFEQSADIIKYHAAQKGLELLLNINHNAPRTALADPIRLKQILLNLLNNAVKFTSEGEVELKVNYIAQSSTSGTYICEVRDTGIGISKQQKERLFKSFSQADSSTTRKYGGTGLGLIISHLLAEKMGGCIDVESSPGNGSVFKFMFTTEVFPEKTGKQSLSIHKVLIVDDNQNNRTILEQLLKFWGIECEVASGGYEAMEKTRQSGFDLILMDYHMPDINGLETAKQINKGRSQKNRIPVILLHSSANNNEIREKAKKIGIKHSLSKPIKSSELYQYLCSIDSQVTVTETDLNGTPGVEFECLKGTPSVLIAEDVLVNRLLLKAIINKYVPDAKILEAVNGEEAVNLVASKNVDLIFMDLQMPVMDGFEATRRIRRILNGHAKSVKIIALTAGALQEDKDNALSLGMDAFLTKPIDQKKMSDVLNTFLRIDRGTNQTPD